jgi:hypothetical protein
MTELAGLPTTFLLNKVDKVERLPAWVNYIAKRMDNHEVRHNDIKITVLCIYDRQRMVFPDHYLQGRLSQLEDFGQISLPKSVCFFEPLYGQLRVSLCTLHAAMTAGNNISSSFHLGVLMRRS